jgi:hypothetical protein
VATLGPTLSVDRVAKGQTSQCSSISLLKFNLELPDCTDPKCPMVLPPCASILGGPSLRSKNEGKAGSHSQSPGRQLPSLPTLPRDLVIEPFKVWFEVKFILRLDFKVAVGRGLAVSWSKSSKPTLLGLQHPGLDLRLVT